MAQSHATESIGQSDCFNLSAEQSGLKIRHMNGESAFREREREREGGREP